MLIVALAATSYPMLHGVVQALEVGWVPFGDEAALGVRSADVFTRQTPLLGMPTGVITDDKVANHPGPLLFWFNAPFVTLFGLQIGLLVAAAALNIGAVVAIGLLTFRRHGVATALLALAATALLVGSLFGSGTIFRPFNPQVVILALLALLFLCWWTATGERRLLPAVVVVASLIVQADLAFLPIVAGAVGAALVGLLFGGSTVLPARPTLPRPHPTTVVRVGQWSLFAVIMACLVWSSSGVGVLDTLRPVAIVVVVTAAIVFTGWWWRNSGSNRRRATVALAVCWLLPAVDVVANGGGNVWRLADLLSEPVDVQGAEYSSRAAGAVLSVPPLVLGHLREDRFLQSVAWWSVVLVAVGWLALLVGVVRRRLRSEATLLVVAATVTVVGIVSAARVPAFEGFVPQHLNWVLVLNAFLLFALARAGTALAATARSGELARAATGTAAVAALAVIVPYSLPRNIEPHLTYEAWLYDAVPDIGASVMDSIDQDGRYVVLPSGGRPYWEAANGLVGLLEERGVATATEQLVPYYGPARDGRTVALEGSLAIGPADVAYPPEGGRLVASYRPEDWDPAAVDDLGREVKAAVRNDGPLRLTDEGSNELVQAIYGHVPEACQPARWSSGPCGAQRRFQDDPDLLLDLPASVILELYREGHVASPTLSPDLRTRLDQQLATLPVDVYLAGPAAR